MRLRSEIASARFARLAMTTAYSWRRSYFTVAAPVFSAGGCRLASFFFGPV